MFIEFARASRDLARNPLGIIALFILLVYGFACIVLGVSGKTMGASERAPLIWFLVVFPVIVLCAFYRLVAKHHRKLYAPGDYRDESHFFDQQDGSMIARQPSTGASPEEVEALLRLGEDSVVVRNNEDFIRQDLEKRNLKTDSEESRILIRQLALAQSTIWFERTYNLIFGSQLRLLKHLNETKRPVDNGYVKNYFLVQQQRFPEEFSSWTADNYINFMLNTRLVEQVGEGFIITPEGSEFLVELARRGFSEAKGL